MYLQMKLEKWKTGNSPLGNGADVGAHKMEEEDIVDENETAVSSTLRKDKRTALSKRFKTMAPFGFIYDMDFGNLAEEHDIDARSHMSEKLGILLAEPSYSVQRDRNSDHAEYFLSGSNNMKDMAKALEEP